MRSRLPDCASASGESVKRTTMRSRREAARRDEMIDHYIQTLENLGKADIHMVCYNFMPVFDWTRTELARKRPDGSTVLAYTQKAVDELNPEKMFASIGADTNGFILPGWETGTDGPERGIVCAVPQRR